jgi:hypothetical protein
MKLTFFLHFLCSLMTFANVLASAATAELPDAHIRGHHFRLDLYTEREANEYAKGVNKRAIESSNVTLVGTLPGGP